MVDRRNPTTIELAQLIAVETNLILHQVAGFANMLRKLGHGVPKDAHTIMKTPTNVLPNDNFIHIGLITAFLRRLPLVLKNNTIRTVF